MFKIKIVGDFFVSILACGKHM